MDITKKYVLQFIKESDQKSEAKAHRRDIDFDNIGGGFTVAVRTLDRTYGIECSGYSNNTSKNLAFVNDSISYTRQGYEEVIEKQAEILKDLKLIADKFDADVAKVFDKHGFKKIEGDI